MSEQPDKPKWVDLFGIAPDFELAPPPKYAIDSGWLVEVVDYHTCGAGGDGYGHEPGCGLIPVADIANLLAARDRQVRAEALREAAEASVSDSDDCIPWDHDHDRATVAVWLHDRADRIEAP